MPLLRLQLSIPLATAERAPLLARLSTEVARALGKPEAYMMVILEPEVPMLMSGTPDPAAFFELRSVGSISAAQAASLSERVSAVLSEATGIAADRVYSNYSGVPGAMWGHDGGTFG